MLRKLPTYRDHFSLFPRVLQVNRRIFLFQQYRICRRLNADEPGELGDPIPGTGVQLTRAVPAAASSLNSLYIIHLTFRADNFRYLLFSSTDLNFSYPQISTSLSVAEPKTYR